MPAVRLDLYHVIDPDDISDQDPKQTVNLPFSIKSGGAWQQLDLAIPPSALGGAGSKANAAMIYLVFDAPGGSASTLDVDELALVEWRNAAQMTDRFGLYDLVRNADPVDHTLNISGWPATSP
jgi:hypothetical protein